MWTMFHWVVRVGIVLWLVLMLRAAWKDRLPGTLVFGALLTMFIGVYPALRFSGLGEFIRGALAGTPPPEATADYVTKRFLAAGLWTVVLTVPGPFSAVMVQVVFRTLKRARGDA
jgi:hypothetical protein